MKKCGTLSKLTWLLVVVGALNWGLIAIDPSWNLVSILLGSWPVVERVVYGLVGLSAVYSLISMATCKDCQ